METLPAAMGPRCDRDPEDATLAGLLVNSQRGKKE